MAEKGRTEPAVRFVPELIRFIGFDPRPVSTGLAERLKARRIGLGPSQRELARRLAIDPGTLSEWETGRREPMGRYLERVKQFLEE